MSIVAVQNDKLKEQRLQTLITKNTTLSDQNTDLESKN